MPKFMESYPELSNAPDRNGRVKTDTSSGRRMDKKIDELINRLNRLGFKLATVVNVNPFPVTVDLGYCGRHTIKACKQGEPYVAYVIRKPLFHPIEKPEADRDVDAIMPVELAAEFVRETRQMIFSDKVGDDVEQEGFHAQAGVGAFWYEGSSEQYPEELFNRAKELQQRWYQILFEEAENAWAKSANRREIHERMRDAARYMLSIKAIDVLPAWVTAKADVKGAEEKKATTRACDICGETVGINAAMCPKCSTMFKPEMVKQLRPDIYYSQRPHERPKEPAPKA